MTVHTTCSHYIQQSPYHAGLVDTDSCPDESVHHISVASIAGIPERSPTNLYVYNNYYVCVCVCKRKLNLHVIHNTLQ